MHTFIADIIFPPRQTHRVASYASRHFQAAVIYCRRPSQQQPLDAPLLGPLPSEAKRRCHYFIAADWRRYTPLCLCHAFSRYIVITLSQARARLGSSLSFDIRIFALRASVAKATHATPSLAFRWLSDINTRF